MLASTPLAHVHGFALRFVRAAKAPYRAKPRLIIARRQNVGRSTNDYDDSAPDSSQKTTPRSRRQRRAGNAGSSSSSPHSQDEPRFKFGSAYKQKEPFDAELVVLFGLPTLIIIVPWALKDPAALAIIPLVLLIPGPRDILLAVVRDFFTGFTRASMFMNDKRGREREWERERQGWEPPPPPPPPFQADEQWWSQRPVVYDLQDDEFAVQPLPSQESYNDAYYPYQNSATTGAWEEDQKDKGYYRAQWGDPVPASAPTQPGDSGGGVGGGDGNRSSISTVHNINSNNNNNYGDKAASKEVSSSTRKRRWVKYSTGTSSSSEGEISTQYAASASKTIGAAGVVEVDSEECVVQRRSSTGRIKNSTTQTQRPVRIRRRVAIESADALGGGGVQVRKRRQGDGNLRKVAAAAAAGREIVVSGQQRRTAGRLRRVPWYLRPLVTLLPFLKDWGGFM